MNPLSPEQTAQFAHFCMERTSEAILWVDAQGHLLYGNAAASRALAFDEAVLRNHSLSDVCPELTQDLWLQLWKELAQRDSFTFEFSLRAKTGRLFLAEIDAHPLEIDKQKFACLFFRDAEERKRLQQLKDEFVSTVSHELRTPMTIIREGVSQVIEGLRGEVTPQQHRALTIALTGIDRLGRIINELLDVSKIEAGKMVLRRERLDIAELLQEVSGTFRFIAQERGIEIHTEFPKTPIAVYADHDRIIQVLTNLVGNAVKFTERGQVTIGLRTHENDLECFIQDTGMGIPREDLAKVFNKFEQLGRVSVTGEKGTGLGLSICKGIIELHRGKIWAESEGGQGARFTFSLPLESARQVFKEQLTDLVKEAAARGATLTAAVFEIAGSDAVSGDVLTPIVNGLENLVRKHSGRKTDIMTQDARGIFVGLPATVKKEGLRVTERITQAFQEAVLRQGLENKVRIRCTMTSFPEDTPSQEEFLARVFGNGKE